MSFYPAVVCNRIESNISQISLAWAELFFAMGTVFRQFEFKLYETDVSDVEMKYNFFTPRIKFDSKGVRVLISKARD